MYIGIDIGGTTIKYGLVADTGLVSNKHKIATPTKKIDLYTVLKGIVSELSQQGVVKGVGVSAPGIIQKDGFMTTGGAITYLYGVNLKEELEHLLNLPVRVENDANAAAIAEKWIGNAQDASNYLCLVLGTGVGGGIIINDQVYRGGHGMAGEFGYMLTQTLDWEREIEDFSLNRTASVITGLCQRYNKEILSNGQANLAGDDASYIISLALSGDTIANKVLNDYTEAVSVGLLNLIGAFDPEIILIGGGISDNTDFFEKLVQSFDQLLSAHDSLNYLKNKTVGQLKPTKLRNDAGLIGAVYQLHLDLLK